MKTTRAQAGGTVPQGVAPAERPAREFYAGPTLEVAQGLLGMVLVHELRGARTSGMIVEVEAYIGEDDPACHAACGLTGRNAPLYGPPGFAYVYLNYGVHALVNVVTEPRGTPAAVLIRALAPLEGLATMRRRRSRGRSVGPPDDEALCRGPGNLTRALGISLRHNRVDLCGSRLFLERGPDLLPATWSGRVGIRVGTDRSWRAFVGGHPCVSGPRRAADREARGGPPSGSGRGRPIAR